MHPEKYWRLVGKKEIAKCKTLDLCARGVFFLRVKSAWSSLHLVFLSFLISLANLVRKTNIKNIIVPTSELILFIRSRETSRHYVAKSQRVLSRSTQESLINRLLILDDQQNMCCPIQSHLIERLNGSGWIKDTNKRR